MKKHISFLLVISLIVNIFSFMPVSAVADTKPTNYISESSFESIPNGKYFYWGFDAWHGDGFSGDAASWMTGTVTDEMAYSGCKSLKVESVRWWTIHKTVEVTKNTDYTFVFYMYMPLGANTDLNYAGLRYITASDPASYRSSTSVSIQPFCTEYYDGDQYAPSTATIKQNVYGKWQRYEFKFNSREFTSVKLGLNFAGMADGLNYVYLDDLGLYASSDFDCYSYNKFSNGNFSSLNNFTSNNWEFSFENFSGKANNKAATVSTVTDINLASLKNNNNAISINLQTGGNFLMWSNNTYKLKENTTYKVEFLVKTKNLSRLKGYIYEPHYTDRLNNPNYKESPYEGHNIYSYKYDGGEDTANSPYRQTRLARTDLSFKWDINGTTLSSDGSSMVQTTLNNDPSSTYGNGGWITLTATFTTNGGNWSYSGSGKGAENLQYAANVAIGIGCGDQSQAGSILIGGFSLKEMGKFEDNVAAGLECAGASIRVQGVPALKFKTHINTNLLNYFYEGYTLFEVGALALKTKYLNGGELSFDSTYTYGGVKRAAKSTVLWTEHYAFPKDGILSLTLSNILSTDYNSKYSYRPYAKLKNGNDEVLIYGFEYSASLAEIAMLAVNSKRENGNFTETIECRNLIEERFLSLLTPTELAVLNDSAYINTDFFGANWAVYHGTTYMKDSSGRNYTEEMAQKEFDRLADSGISGVRTIFRSTWMHPLSMTFTGWDFETEEMTAFYKWAKEMQKRDIEIIITAGWLLTWYAREEYTENLWYDEVPYLHGDGEDYYGESAGVNFTGMTNNEIRLKKASLRYGEWVRRCLAAFEEHGVYNVNYVLCFTEPSSQQVANSSTGYEGTKLGLESVEYVTMVKGLHEVLTKHGVRNTVKIIGPNQATGLNVPDMILMEYCLKELKDTGVIDIYTAHSYPATAPSISYTDGHIPDIFWNYHEYIMKEYIVAMANQGYTGAFLFDEFTGGGPLADPKQSALFGVQSVAGMINVIKNGADGIMRWNIFDQLWPNSNSNTGEFKEGIHVTGLAPSFFESYVPRNQYYSISLFTKYIKGLNNVVNCKDFRVGNDLYYIVLEDDQGNITAAMLNTGQASKYVNLTFEKSLNNKVMYRHLFDSASSNPTEDAILSPTDKIIRVNNEIKDVLPAGSIMIYTTINN